MLTASGSGQRPRLSGSLAPSLRFAQAAQADTGGQVVRLSSQGGQASRGQAREGGGFSGHGLGAGRAPRGPDPSPDAMRGRGLAELRWGPRLGPAANGGGRRPARRTPRGHRAARAVESSTRTLSVGTTQRSPWQRGKAAHLAERRLRRPSLLAA